MFIKTRIWFVFITEIPYEVTVWTGDMKGAGTDANVFLQMYGEYGVKTEELQLRNRTDNFEQDQCDKFKVSGYAQRSRFYAFSINVLEFTLNETICCMLKFEDFNV